MKNLRILYTVEKEKADCLDLCVTPTALVGLDSISKRNYLKPIDFMSPQDIKTIKAWVFNTVMAMDVEWRKLGNEFPELIKTIGADLSVFLEHIKVADTVLNRVIDEFGCSVIYVGLFNDNCNMVQYEGANYGYIDLAADSDWAEQRRIKVVIEPEISVGKNYINEKAFNPPVWKTAIRRILSFLRIMSRLRIDPLSFMLMKLGIFRPAKPSLLVVHYKDAKFMLKCKRSVALNDYLMLLPEANDYQVSTFRSMLIGSLSKLLAMDTSGLENIRPFKNIIKNKLQGFLDKRTDLLESYLKVRNIGSRAPRRMLLESALGCAADAWCSTLIQEQGGTVASAQHGGAYGNAKLPLHLFSDYRFSYFFSYGNPCVSPMNEILRKYEDVKQIMVGSPILDEIRGRCGRPPSEIKRVLYVMNLCVPFYSANFPWEHILEQLKVLDLLERHSHEYLVDVKKDHTDAIREDRYKGLTFIEKSPRDVLHKYDLIIVESSISTAVLEAVMTSSYIALFTGSEWEDVSRESLDMLSKRAESFDTWSDFHSGLERILDNPRGNLDSRKLNSSDFVETYCNPVTSDQYFNTVRTALDV